MKQFTKLIEFRQAVYEHGLTRAKDTQFELVDALLLSPVIRSFPELSFCPAFRRQWMSAYEAIRKGRQDQDWLERYFMRLVPTTGPKVFSLDGTAWPHPQAKVMEDLQYVYSPTSAIDGGNIVIGHPYSVLAWVPEIGRSWAPPMSVRRIPSQQTAVEMGVAQVRLLCDERREEMMQSLHLIVADGAYGNHRFLGPLKNEPCGVVARLRRDRVLYGAPGPYRGHGRPRVHGDRFAFKEPETWGKPDTVVELKDEHWGKVRLRRWDHLHALQDAKTASSWQSAIWSERNLPSHSGWPTSRHPINRRVNKAWSTCGADINTAGLWNPAFVSASNIYIGPCRDSKNQNAVTAGQCWSASHSGSCSWRESS